MAAAAASPEAVVERAKKEKKKKEIASAHRERSGTRVRAGARLLWRDRGASKKKSSVSAAKLQPLLPPITF
jgi:hypothetical protein